MKLKHTLYAAAIVLTLAVILTVAGSGYLLSYSLRPQNRGKNLEESARYMRQTYPYISHWMDSLTANHLLRDTFITAPDGIRLHAYYAYAGTPTARTAVIVHGYTDNAIRMMHIGYLYHHALHYNILLPDLRYSGLSGGEAFQMGWLDRKDVIQWIRLAPHLFGDSIKSIVHGISMGAATTMMVSGEKLPPYVRCFVEDCGYTSVWDQFGKELKERFHLPAFPLLYTASIMCRMHYGWDFHEASALRQVEHCRRPMLFIHGSKDDFVPTRMVYTLYRHKPQPKELWIAPGTDHAHAYRDYPEIYTQKVEDFAGKYLR